VEQRARQGADDREALAKRAPGIEVRRQGDRRARVDHRPRLRHRTVEEERARREHDADHVARGKGGDARLARRFEMVDRPRADFDRERYGAELCELVAVQAQCQPCLPAGSQIAACLPDVERAALDEDVCGFGDPRRRRQDLREQKVEVLVGVVELRRHRVRAQEGRNPPFLSDHLE
jgi:hypothetical protein